MAKIRELFDRGLAVRKEVLGKAHVEAALQGASSFTEDFQTFLTECAWGSVWARPGLDRKTRSMLTIAMLAALGQHEELRLHIRATPRTGVSREEVKEILLQVAVYAGVPAANSAFQQAKAAFQQMEKEAKAP
jgi:4-carboxymuconolactone decarboxylase